MLRRVSAAVVLAACIDFLGSTGFAQAPAVSRPAVPGALRGKTVFLSAGHGFYHHPTLGWITQRGNSNGLVEDFLTAELVNGWLVPYLENAGADVWTCRERSWSTVEVIVDDRDSSAYRESGTWLDTSSGGFRGGARYASSAASETAVATFTPEVPASGHYPLWLWFIAGSNRSSATLVRVRHGGGTTSLRLTQQRDGRTWRYAGTFYWATGRGQSVEISNQASGADIGRVVIADAIRIGGGIGSEPPNGGGAPSGRRRADESSVYWARYQGAPESVWNPIAGDRDDTDDVTCRPRYAEWESEAGEDAVYVSVHSNAGGGRGTETYAYLDGTPSGSLRLRDLIQEEVVSDLRATWDAAWPDRGTRTADFGELRLLETMPGALVEIAFHDHATDAALEKEPLWRRDAARAIYHAIARYFGGDGVALAPEPPREVRARVVGSRVLLTWGEPVSGSRAGGARTTTGYRVYRSRDGFAFDGGVAVAREELLVDSARPGETAFFRVTAVNAGGESFPSELAGARVPLAPEAPDARVLVVNGYDRLDAGLNDQVNESGALGTVARQLLGRRMNSFDYAVEHVLGLASLPFDLAIETAANEAVVTSGEGLGGYDLVDWFAGRDGVQSDTLEPAERALLADFAASGGALLVSGQDLGTDLDASSSPAARVFFRDVLRAELRASDSGERRVRGLGRFAGLEPFDLGAPYPAVAPDLDRPDAYAPRAGARTALVYPDSMLAAAVEYEGAYRLIHCGFPLEAVRLRGARDLFLDRAARFLLGAGDSPPEVRVRSTPSGGVVRLSGGRAEVILDAGASDDGEGGTRTLGFEWRKVSGPAGDTLLAAESREVVLTGAGYGDGDDATALDGMRGAYAVIFLRHEFDVARPAERLFLRASYDDGFTASINGVEVARRNLADGAPHDALALVAGEPVDETMEISEWTGLLRPGEVNVVALAAHNASLASSDLSIDAELVAETARGVEVLVPARSRWYLHRGTTPPPAGWSSPEFEATPRAAHLVFRSAGAYAYRVTVSDGASLSASEVEIRVLPEAIRFRRGDANDDGAVDISDAVATLVWLFSGAAPPPCIDAADANDSGGVDLSDAVRTVSWLFSGAPEPPPPGPVLCGSDPTEDALAECEGRTCG